MASPTGNYIVVFQDDVTSEQINNYAEQVEKDGGNIKERFDPILNGFSASIADATFQSFQSLQGSVIKYIEPDQTVTTQ
ncbi:protease propeptide inhibitor [Pyrrhoderma noxium]|uniref:Protease propeptide inhibitor n=1 Tax=Pyrrhoderma noxium TaxID=2282107 RepID=A0A286UHH7_9AGAM|nr:protease propeptide inhibitor [Pyrrhoderma noxium]